MTKFTPGTIYATRSICDYNCVFSFTVVRRTAKFITIEDKFGEAKRVGVSEGYDGGYEIAYPLGKFSMAPLLRADRAGVIV